MDSTGITLNDLQPRSRQWRRYLLLALAAGGFHALVWLEAWGYLFAMGDYCGAAPAPRRPALEAFVSILGVPLQRIPSDWQIALRAVFGSDSGVLLALAALNGLIWGGAFAPFLCWLRHAHRRGGVAV